MENQRDHTFHLLLDACIKGKRSSQKELYRQYYAYGMHICLHYAKNREEAGEILNDGFLKVFRHLSQYKRSSPFKAWLRRILINAAIDYYRKYRQEELNMEVVYLRANAVQNEAIDKLDLEGVMTAVQALPASYRLVFNLFAVEGYSHPEIAKMLGIAVGTSKSNYAKAREKLQQALAAYYPHQTQAK